MFHVTPLWASVAVPYHYVPGRAMSPATDDLNLFFQFSSSRILWYCVFSMEARWAGDWGLGKGSWCFCLLAFALFSFAYCHAQCIYLLEWHRVARFRANEIRIPNPICVWTKMTTCGPICWLQKDAHTHKNSANGNPIAFQTKWQSSNCSYVYDIRRRPTRTHAFFYSSSVAPFAVPRCRGDNDKCQKYDETSLRNVYPLVHGFSQRICAAFFFSVFCFNLNRHRGRNITLHGVRFYRK